MNNTENQELLASLRKSVNNLSQMTDETELNAASSNIQKQLDELNSSMDRDLTTSGEVLTMQDTVYDILKEEKDELQLRKDEIDNKITGSRRDILFKKGIQSRQVEYNKIAFVIIITLVIIYLCIIGNVYLSIIPSFVYYIISAISIVVAFIYSFNKIIIINSRTKANYDEIIKEPPKGVNESSRGGSTNKVNNINYDVANMVCVGSKCCGEGLEYDNKTNVCVTKSDDVSKELTESFVHKYLAIGRQEMENFGKV